MRKVYQSRLENEEKPWSYLQPTKHESPVYRGQQRGVLSTGKRIRMKLCYGRENFLPVGRKMIITKHPGTHIFGTISIIYFGIKVIIKDYKGTCQESHAWEMFQANQGGLGVIHEAAYDSCQEYTQPLSKQS